MFYYLETNALINIGRNIQNLPNLANCYTSNLAILELIKNLNDTSFSQRQALLRIISTRQLKIDWEFSIAKVYSAFSINTPGFSGYEFLKDAYHLLLESKSYSDYIAKLKAHNLDAAMESVQGYLNSTELLRTQFINPIIQKMKSYFKDERFRTPDDIADLDLLTIGIKISSLPVAENCRTAPEEISRRYNGKIDIYNVIYAYVFILSATNYTFLKRNDLTDLSHLMYLQNRITAIVSNDRFVVETVQKFFPKSAITVDDFKKEYIPSQKLL